MECCLAINLTGAWQQHENCISTERADCSSKRSAKAAANCSYLTCTSSSLAWAVIRTTIWAMEISEQIQIIFKSFGKSFIKRHCLLSYCLRYIYCVQVQVGMNRVTRLDLLQIGFIFQCCSFLFWWFWLLLRLVARWLSCSFDFVYFLFNVYFPRWRRMNALQNVTMFIFGKHQQQQQEGTGNCNQPSGRCDQYTVYVYRYK